MTDWATQMAEQWLDYKWPTDEWPQQVEPLAHLLRTAHRKGEEWQPIATAPKMKTLLLFAVTDVAEDGRVRNWKMETGFFSTGHDTWLWPHPLKVYDHLPTHWMPLPAPPPPPGMSLDLETDIV